MTVTVLSIDHPVARKHHRCDNCRCSIAPGERYERQRNLADDGVPYTWKSHEDCMELAVQIADWGDEGIPPLCNAEREAIEEWRGFYPHAVCRTELGWELARNAAA